MSEQDNVLTLQGLAQRLEALEGENARMRSENAELRSKVSTLEGSGTRRDEVPAMRGSGTRRHEEAASESDGLVSRRSLLSKAGAAAVAAVAAGTLLHPREAKAAGDAEFEQVNCRTLYARGSGTHQASIYGNNGYSGPGVEGRGVIGVWGTSTIQGEAGVYGDTAAPLGDSRTPAVLGPGVVGKGRGNEYAGVLGRNDTGTGVWGKSGQTGYQGVYGEHTGTTGYGVAGDGKGSCAGVLGRNPSASGSGVSGLSTSGYGGYFEGGRAQLMLKPNGGTAGKPTTGAHDKGEIYMDSAATLWVCTASGTPGTWRKVATTAT